MNPVTAPARRSVLVTGASGLVGRKVVERLAAERDNIDTIVALDLREPPVAERREGIVYAQGDVRDPAIADIFARHHIDTVVHLAAVVTPGKHSSRDAEYAIDVLGTQNVVEACVRTGVRTIVYTSSGAAYGFHADNPRPLHETDALRGNPEFAYSDHKRLVEEMLARYRTAHPELEQLIFRPGTILGATVASPISAMFERALIIGVAGSDAPFVLIWDEDVAACIVKGICERRTGIYNLTGDGAVSLREIARRLGKPYLPVPAGLLKGVLGLLKAVGLSERGGEQVDFLRYRPVLSNERLKTEFGFIPSATSAECFERYRRARFRELPRTATGQEPVVVITGAAGGIGTALAHRFGRAGARLGLLDRDRTGVERLAAELQAQGISALPLAGDVTSLDDCRRAMASVSETWGGIDVLINNAGMTHLGRFRDADVEVIRRVMEVNFFGAVNCTKAALPSLLERRGQIVVTSSLAGVAPLPTRSGYAASKHALHGFFESLRAEHAGEGLHVTMVCPTYVRTGIGQAALGGDGRPAAAGARTGVRGEIEPEVAADAIFRGTVAGRRLVLVPGQARLAYLVSRCAPALYERIISRQVAP